jgi:hypothetical protein
MEERDMVRMSVFILGLAISGAPPCLAAGFSSGMTTGACYVYSIDRDLRYCRENVVERCATKRPAHSRWRANGSAATLVWMSITNKACLLSVLCTKACRVHPTRSAAGLSSRGIWPSRREADFSGFSQNLPILGSFCLFQIS